MLDLVPGCCAAQDEPLEMMTIKVIEKYNDSSSCHVEAFLLTFNW
jgi:hypothetical protein